MGHIPHSEFDWKKLKKTKQRRLVAEVLGEADTPLSAPEISAALERRGTPVWLSTVYRVLDTFVEHDILHKSAVLENGMALYELAGHSHRHYAECVACHRVIPLESCPLESFQPGLGEDFEVLGHRLQMYGLCGGCKKHGRSTEKPAEADVL